jgi:hypothetical protein
VKNFQGRFLELDKTTGMYVEIKEKRAIEKTSQALREGQSKIKQLFLGKSEEDPIPHTPEYYFAYSVKVLSELYAADTNPDLVVNLMLPPLPTLQKSRSEQDHVPPLPPVKKNTANDALNNAVKNALDQFPMASQSIDGNPPQPPGGTIADRSSQYSDMAVASLSTISDIHTISSGQSSKASRGSSDTFITAQGHQNIYAKEKRCYQLDFIDEGTTRYDDTPRMGFNLPPPEEGAAKESTCSHYSPTNQSVDDFSMDTMGYLIGHRDTTEMSFTSLLEETGKETACSTHSLMNQSVGDFSVDSDAELSDTFVKM